MQTFFRYYKTVRACIEYTDREIYFHKEEIYDRRFYINKISGLRMRRVTWNRCPLNNLLGWFACLARLWVLVTWIQICLSLNHRKKMKAEP